MLFYDWHKIYEASEGNPFTIMLIVRMMVGNVIPENKYDRLYKFSNKNFTGESFMVHPDILLFNSYKYEYGDIAQYIALCSFRPYVDYQTTGNIHLDLLTVDIDQELFKDNSLLRIEGDDVHFIYEEVPKEKLH
jgi:hypothetical protein|tara:strand:+ start:233 stop:634 length:402 start_codon:yes stop_codon:yes gene_type:complete